MHFVLLIVFLSFDINKAFDQKALGESNGKLIKQSLFLEKVYFKK